MPSLNRYSDTSNKSGVYILANVGGSHPITLQVTPLGQKILERVGYHHGDDLPTQFVWSMYDVGILYTSNTLTEEPEMQEDPDEVFKRLNIPTKLSKNERRELIRYLAEYTGPNEDEVKSLREHLQESNQPRSNSSEESKAVEVDDQRPNNSKPTVGEGSFLSIEIVGSGYKEIPDRSGESYVNCFVLLLEVTNNASAEWEFYGDKELSVILDSGESIGTPAPIFFKESLSPWAVNRDTISSKSRGKILLAYPAEDGPVIVDRLEYKAKPIHRHAGINPRGGSSPDPEHIIISLDEEIRGQIAPLPDSLEFESVELDIQTAASKARAKKIDIDLCGFEYSEKDGVMLVFIEIENNTPTTLDVSSHDFTVVSGDGYTYQEMGDGSYEGIPSEWNFFTMIIPSETKSRVMLPFGTNEEFIPAQIMLHRYNNQIDINFETEEILDKRGAPESVDIEEMTIDLR